MATELGQAYVQIMPSAKGISGSIQREFDPEATAAGKSAGSKLGTGLKLAGAAAVAAAAVALGKIVSSSLTEGAALQQSLGGVETLFKENADKVKKYADEAYKTAGLSANAYMENVTSFSASLLQSLEGDTAKAADKADMAMVDMSDNANKFGSNIESIQNAYQGFAKQNYTMLDNLKLGYGGTKDEMERLLADAQKLTGVKYDIKNLADVYDAIHVIQEELGVTGTTALESAETLSGSLASMKGAFSNVLGNLALGRDITPALQALAQTVSTFLFGNLFPMVGNVLKALPGAVVTFLKEATPYFLKAGAQFISGLTAGVASGSSNLLTTITNTVTTMLDAMTEKYPVFLEKGEEILTSVVAGILQNVPQLLESVGTIVTSFVNFLLKNLPTIMETGKDMLLTLVNGIITNLPAIIDSGVKVLSKFLDVLIANFPKILATGAKILLELVAGIISNLPQLIAAVIVLMAKLVAMLISKLPDVVKAGIQIVGSLVSGIGQVASSLLNKGAEIMNGLMSKINEFKSRFYDAGRNIVTAIADGIRGAIGQVTSAISSVTQKVRDFLPFSPAKEGPLKDLNKLDFAIIADGIYNAKKPITSAMQDLAQSTLDSYELVAAKNDTSFKTSYAVQSPGFAQGGNIIIEKMEVRDDSDIGKIARELFNLERLAGRGLGLV